MQIRVPKASPQTATEPARASTDSTPSRHTPKSDIGLVTLRRLKIEDIEPAPYNPRTMSEKAKRGLANSIGTFGLVEPIIWNERTGYIVGGHQRFNELKEQGCEETDVIVVNLDHAEEIALNLTLNNTHIQGDWMEEQRESLLRELEAQDADLAARLQLDLLKLPEWEPLPDAVKPEGEDVRPEKIVIKVLDVSLRDEVLGEVQRLLNMHWDKTQVSL